MSYSNFCRITWTIFLILLSFSTATAQVAAPHSFSISQSAFRVDGKPVQIRSGEMHYARIPKAYWKHRLQMVKAMGLNTVATYVFWNYHEVEPGVWDFKTENRNLAEFIKLAGDEGLMVILRPGPYVCAEWEFGGYPWWILKEKSLVLRSYNKPFLDSCQTYIQKVAAQVKHLQITQGGPIIMVQAENEFGSYVDQRKDVALKDHQIYTAAIKKQLLDAGFTVPLFTADGGPQVRGGFIENVWPTVNGEDNVDTLKKVVNAYTKGEGPYMVAEFYPGWLDHWGERFVKVPTKDVVAQTATYVQAGVSFNFYMVHGGTNFGFTSGANYDRKHDLQPDITSYDYDAPISEAGWATPKYMALRDVLQPHAASPVPAVPAAIPVIDIPSIALTKTVDVFDLKEKIKPQVHDTPLTFEDLNQGYGYVLYSRKFTQPVKGTLEIKGLRDYAWVYVNRRKVAELNRIQNAYTCEIDIPANATLDILVENMGRINYGAAIIHNLKGIISPVMINAQPVTGNWQMYRLPMTTEPNVKTYTKSYTAGHPVIYTGSFTLSSTGDTFMDMRTWGKGIVFVNGHHLGRYWSIGPQQTLYLPGCWLKTGVNTLTIFEQQNASPQKEVRCIRTPVLEELKN